MGGSNALSAAQSFRAIGTTAVRLPNNPPLERTGGGILHSRSSVARRRGRSTVFRYAAEALHPLLGRVAAAVRGDGRPLGLAGGDETAPGDAHRGWERVRRPLRGD